MNIAIVIALLLVLAYILSVKSNEKNLISKQTEHMTDEAVQNLSSLAKMYDTGAMAVKDVKVTGGLQLGDKFRLSGTGDKMGNDEWLRLTNLDSGAYSGGFAANKIWTSDLTVGGNTNITGALKSGDHTIGATLNSPGRMHISPSGDDLYLIPRKGGVIVGNHWGGTGNLTVTGTLTAGKVGSDDNLIMGRWGQERCGDPPAAGTVVGNHSQLFNSGAPCYQICPPGSYMIGIRNGYDWDHKAPVCRKFQ
jgi:hypothetical protein